MKRGARGCVLCSLAILGCPAADSGGAATGSTSSDGPSGTGSAANMQTEACRSYLECAAEHVPGELAQLIDAFGPSGSCWEGDPSLATTCDQACEAGLADLVDAFGKRACGAPADDEGETTGGETGPSGPPLEIDLGDAPCVRFGVDALSDFIVADNGAPITCEMLRDGGDGRLPDGLTVESNCVFAGTITEERVGGWAQIVRVSQDGVEHLVPFCATTESTSAPYEIAISPSRVMQAAFVPGEPLAFGEPGAPEVEVASPPGLCGEMCFYSYAWTVSASALDGLAFTLADPALLYRDGMPIGLTHGIAMSASAVAGPYDDRPWVFAVEVDYCFSQSSDACVPGGDADDAFFAFALVMRPAK
jgi:hypothetical protein